MKTLTRIVPALLILLALGIAPVGGQVAEMEMSFVDSDEQDTLTAAQIHRMLDQAATALQDQGDGALAEFQNPQNSQWNRPRFGLYVLRVDSGELVAWPQAGDEENAKSYLKPTSINGKPFVHRVITDVHQRSNEGFWHDMLTYVEGTEQPMVEGIYVRAVNSDKHGSQYVLAARHANWKLERTLVEMLVDDAAKLVELTGEKAFETFMDKSSLFYYPRASLFVGDASGEGTVLCDTLFPQITNKPEHYSFTKTDQGLMLLGRTLQNKSGVWSLGTWYLPGEFDTGQRVPKWYYTRLTQHKGKSYIVGMGIYPADPAHFDVKRIEEESKKYRNMGN